MRWGVPVREGVWTLVGARSHPQSGACTLVLLGVVVLESFKHQWAGSPKSKSNLESPVGFFFFFWSMLGHLYSLLTLSGRTPQHLSLFPFCFQLLDTKSTDRKQTLLHYISNVVKEKYHQVSLFYNELHYVEKAAAGTWFQLLMLLLGIECLLSLGNHPCLNKQSRTPWKRQGLNLRSSELKHMGCGVAHSWEQWWTWTWRWPLSVSSL